MYSRVSLIPSKASLAGWAGWAWPTHSFSQWASPAQAFGPRFYEKSLRHCISHVKSSKEFLPIILKSCGSKSGRILGTRLL